MAIKNDGINLMKVRAEAGESRTFLAGCPRSQQTNVFQFKHAGQA